MALCLLVIFYSCLILSSSHMQQAESGFFQLLGVGIMWQHRNLLSWAKREWIFWILSFDLFFFFFSRKPFCIVPVVFRSLIWSFRFCHVVCCVNSYTLPFCVCHLHFPPSHSFSNTCMNFLCVVSFCCFISVSTLCFFFFFSPPCSHQPWITEARGSFPCTSLKRSAVNKVGVSLGGSQSRVLWDQLCFPLFLVWMVLLGVFLHLLLWERPEPVSYKTWQESIHAGFSKHLGALWERAQVLQYLCVTAERTPPIS